MNNFPPIPRMDMPAFAAWAQQDTKPYFANYYAMYTSLWPGITTDPHLMNVPLDDHMVHRGDALFETLRCDNGAAYRLPDHLDRLLSGAAPLQMPIPWSREEIIHTMAQVMHAAGKRDALLRLFITRGPGGHSANPAECPVPTLIIAAIRLSPPFMESHPAGAHIIESHIPVKSGFFANVKSVNYLPNTLMRQEANAAHADFALAFDETGHMAELPTENAAIVTPDRILKLPRPERILRGTTMTRALEIAREHLLADGTLTGIQETDITRADITSAAELLIFGTTPLVAAATRYNHAPIADGHPGPVWQRLYPLLQADLQNPAQTTPLLP